MGGGGGSIIRRAAASLGAWDSRSWSRWRHRWLSWGKADHQGLRSRVGLGWDGMGVIRGGLGPERCSRVEQAAFAAGVWRASGMEIGAWRAAGRAGDGGRRWNSWRCY